MFLALVTVSTILVLYSLISSVYHIEYIRLATENLAYGRRDEVIQSMQTQVSFFKAPLLWLLNPYEIKTLGYIGLVLGISLAAQLVLTVLSGALVVFPFVSVGVLLVVGIAVLLIRRAHSKAKKEIPNG